MSVCVCLATGGGGECWQDWTHHCTVGDGRGSDLRHLVGQNQNLQVSPLFASAPLVTVLFPHTVQGATLCSWNLAVQGLNHWEGFR